MLFLQIKLLKEEDLTPIFRVPRGSTSSNHKAEIAPADAGKSKKGRKDTGKNTAALERRRLSEIKASTEDVGVVMTVSK